MGYMALNTWKLATELVQSQKILFAQGPWFDDPVCLVHTNWMVGFKYKSFSDYLVSRISNWNSTCWALLMAMPLATYEFLEFLDV